MALRIRVHHKRLIDSPYNLKSEGIFTFANIETSDIVNDLIHGNPTCYLISGYRGSGKSSFVNKVQELTTAESPNSIFIHLNFAKYESKAIVLRKLIRHFYLEISSNVKHQEVFKKLQRKNQFKEPLAEFRELYDRTFYEVSKNSNIKESKKNSSTRTFEFDIKETILAIAGISQFLIALNCLDLSDFGNYAIMLFSLIIAALTIAVPTFTQAWVRTKESETNSESSKTSFYDDEIAEHLLSETLKAFRTEIKPVFVLDEIDKINDPQLEDKLINELKPLMLSGMASFIVVAGQKLYYRYYLEHTVEDNPISSLFAKTHHVPLFHESKLRTLFLSLLDHEISGLSEEDIKLINAHLNYLIISSKRIPRRFVSLIRQNLTWQNNSAYLDITKGASDYEIYSKLLRMLNKIEEDQIKPVGYPQAIIDFINMQLMITIAKLLHEGTIPAEEDLAF